MGMMVAGAILLFFYVITEEAIWTTHQTDNVGVARNPVKKTTKTEQKNGTAAGAHKGTEWCI